MPRSHQVIDLTREYHTRGGDRVILTEFKTRNSCGDILTFPLSGTVFDKDRPRRRRRLLWTLEGRCSVFSPDQNDIVDLPPVLNTAPPPCTDCCGQPLKTPASLA